MSVVVTTYNQYDGGKNEFFCATLEDAIQQIKKCYSCGDRAVICNAYGENWKPIRQWAMFAHEYDELLMPEEETGDDCLAWLFED